jgi:hypothetical protein
MAAYIVGDQLPSPDGPHSHVVNFLVEIDVVAVKPS